MRDLRWYASRLLRMTPGEIVERASEQTRKLWWRRRQVRPGRVDAAPPLVANAQFRGTLPEGLQREVPAIARADTLAEAEAILSGSLPIFAHMWDTEVLDWFVDAKSGRRAPNSDYAFSIDHRDEDRVGNIKYVWEPSRHQFVTVLAAAFYLTGEARYAERAIRSLQSWWVENPFLSGIHWTSAIEAGVRLISWVWTRRLLAGFEDVSSYFERDQVFQAQLHHHQEYIDRFASHGTSANNHLVAEMVGLFAAASAFPMFSESSAWRERAQARLTAEIERQTFRDGVNRELATSYHAFSTELFLLASVEGELSGNPFADSYWQTLRSSFDAAAAMLDVRLQPPRQGDDDDAHSLLVDGRSFNRWSSLLATGDKIFGARSWWPETPPDVRSVILGSLVDIRTRATAASRPSTRPTTFAQAGLTVLRNEWDGREIWCRFDHGPHGFTALAGHAHADALSFELRVDGFPILVDPGTYCYHGEPEWRRYFRSTAGHNTIEVEGVDQSVYLGSFMWSKHAATETVSFNDYSVTALHRGYERLQPPVVHHRTLSLAETLRVVDRLEGLGSEQTYQLSFHFGAEVAVELIDGLARIAWPDGSCEVLLPSELSWEIVRGGVSPIAGWYSRAFDVREPINTLRGRGAGGAVSHLVTEFRLGQTTSSFGAQGREVRISG